MISHDDLAATLGISSSSAPPVALRIEGMNGVELSALDWGGAGPNCLFLHGGAMSAQTWTQCCLFLQDNYHCVCLDLRGHGNSGWSDDYSIAAHVSDVIHVLDHLRWSSPHLVGMSLGGVVAAHTVTALADRSPHSLALVDVAPGVSFKDVGRIREFMSSDTVKHGPDALAEEARRLGAPQSSTELLYRYQSLTRLRSDGTWEWKHDNRAPTDFAHILAHIAQLDELASTWDMPCLVARGGRSRILSEVAARTFIQRCQSGHFASVSDAGHSVQEDNPKGLSTALELFWGSLQT